MDRLLLVLLYRIWPQVIDAMVLVKPATVVEWHRRGFRLYWRWRSRAPGRPKISPDIRDLIRRMSRANPLWGAPRMGSVLEPLPEQHQARPIPGIAVVAALRPRYCAADSDVVSDL